MRRKWPEKRLMLGVALVLAGLVLSAAALVTPWWTFATPGEPRFGLSEEYYYGEVCEVGASSLQRFCWPYWSGTEPVKDLFTVAFILVLLGIVLASHALVLIVVGAYWPRTRRAVGAAGIVAAILLILAPIYVFLALPGAVNSADLGALMRWPIAGFFGQMTIDQGGVVANAVYGGGPAWFLSIASSIPLLAGTLLGMAGIRRVAQPQPASSEPSGETEPAQAAESPASPPL